MPKAKRHVLEAPDGSIIVAVSRQGHEDCKLLGTCVGDPPDDTRWCRRAKRFVACEKAAATRRKARRHSHHALREDLDAAIERIAALERRIAPQSQKQEND